MVRAFQHPTSVAPLMLQVLQETPVKPIRIKMPNIIEPAAIARHGVGRIKSQTGEDMRVDFRAFLWRDCSYRMHFTEAGGQQLKHPKLAINAPPPSVAVTLVRTARIGMDQLPDPGNQIGGVRGQQSVQECRTRTRQTGNNDRLLNSRLQNLRRPLLLMPESKKV